MATHHEIHLIRGVEIEGDFVAGYDDESRAVKLHFVEGFGEGLWAFRPGTAGNAFSSHDRTISIMHANTALIEQWED